MTYFAHVVRVMIASPSDVEQGRAAARECLLAWNAANAERRGVILHPVGWESAVPLLGDRAQGVINRQVLDRADIVVALFGERLGQPTGISASGTAEEIQRANEGGKPVHVYFSEGVISRDVDTRQLEALRAFRGELETRGLLGTFSNPQELTVKLWAAIEHDIETLALTTTAAAPAREPSFRAQEREERSVLTDSSGRPRTTTAHWVDLTNVGDGDAHDVLVEAVSGFMRLETGRPNTTFPAGQTRRFDHFVGLGMPDEEKVIRVSWVQDGERKSQNISLG